jgi:folate-binding protein YgfZ
MGWIASLPARGVIEVAGVDRVGFLQGLVSNDVSQAVPGRAVWAALLTPQGKWLTDFFIFSDGERLLLDCERDQISDLIQRLGRYRLRAQVSLAATDLRVTAGASAPPPGQAIAAPDPRLPDAGWRWLGTTPPEVDDQEDAWDAHRLRLGMPDGSRDLEREKSVLLEAGFDELHGIAWDKGCYLGQELTARTRYRGLVKRRLVPVHVLGVLPPPGTPVLRDGAEIGTMRSGRDNAGLALLRLEALHPSPNGPRLHAATAELIPVIPTWMKLPAEAAG